MNSALNILFLYCVVQQKACSDSPKNLTETENLNSRNQMESKVDWFSVSRVIASCSAYKATASQVYALTPSILKQSFCWNIKFSVDSYFYFRLLQTFS
mmetsp:Transcript_14755/g.41123  ORF Transcript_14755/g.41123 Transcript_14755/m.41123 type:complete len:98 (-) Transcript_14755:516-809(-)